MLPIGGIFAIMKRFLVSFGVPVYVNNTWVKGALVYVVSTVIWFLVCGILMILSAKLVRTGNPVKVRKGAIYGLVLSILGVSLLGII